MRSLPDPIRDMPRFSLRVAGIPVQISALALLVPAFGSASREDPIAASIWIVLVVASVLWHELGHAIAMRRFGFGAWIELHAFGGLAHWARGACPTASERLVVTLCGPGAGLALGAAVWGLSRSVGDLPLLARVAIDDALWINVVWSLINLLPVLPFDGGNLLDEIAEIVTGVRHPRWVGLVSLVVGAGGAMWAASHGWSFAAFFGVIGALQGWARWSGSALLPAIR
jgi:hypothetical protein